MDRKKFIQQCGFTCLGAFAFSALAEGCTGAKIITGSIEGSDLIVSVDDFKMNGNSAASYKKYLVVTNHSLKYPVCVYRFSDDNYTALWMRCTHQGAELQVFGDKLQCPAHGSEFSNRGAVENGPADVPLRMFAVRKENGQLKISLKAI